MFCRVCGNELKEKAVICSSCGSPVTEGAETIETNTPRWSWFTMFITIAVILVILLIAIIAGL